MTRYLEPHMAEQLKNHVLEELPSTELIRHFKLSVPTGHELSGLYWVHVLFTPVGIVVGGDLLGRGAIARLGMKGGYGPDWFGSGLSEEYLCSKFFDQAWQRESAGKWCRVRATEYRSGERDDEAMGMSYSVREQRRAVQFKAWSALADRLEGLEIETCDQFLAEARKLGWREGGDLPPGYDYPLVNAGWLCAIQQKFAVEWQKLAAAAMAMKAMEAK